MDIRDFFIGDSLLISSAICKLYDYYRPFDKTEDIFYEDFQGGSIYFYGKYYSISMDTYNTILNKFI